MLTRSRSGSAISISCNVAIRVHNHETGARRLIRTHNLVVASGLNKIRDLIGYPITGDIWTPAYVALGTSNTATTSAMTTLIGEVYRKAITQREALTAGLVFYLYLDTTEANGNTLCSVGLFTESSGGELWSRAVHTAIVKSSAVSVNYEWTWNLAAS
jgi:hypothetical protein